MIFTFVLIFILPALTLCGQTAKIRMYLVQKPNEAPKKYIGIIKLTQYNSGLIKFYGTVKGLKPGAHGFHIHEKGDLGNGCRNAGAHLNLYNKPHGGLKGSRRHQGDLENIIADKKGVAIVNVTVCGLGFKRPVEIMKRSLVIHEKEDDLGLGNHVDSPTTGNSGGRVACGLFSKK
ncbi:Superoxide dismutase [Cu-Zn] [Strongyloides ratti]|uniref:Superoxide dismutase [Cu-Zn] n=1 Tax=Strongyloides ratti TaxID=34506 RepID=A0A090LLL5_STRRB|nr:Superoxide dismutase [Cu-Zn] [Strongyloides ratti]CEF68445.1 Superoxide dismutase [Cu-Zn] [Strongyloides ratti]